MGNTARSVHAHGVGTMIGFGIDVVAARGRAVMADHWSRRRRPGRRLRRGATTVDVAERAVGGSERDAGRNARRDAGRDRESFPDGQLGADRERRAGDRRGTRGSLDAGSVDRRRSWPAGADNRAERGIPAEPLRMDQRVRGLRVGWRREFGDEQEADPHLDLVRRRCDLDDPLSRSISGALRMRSPSSRSWKARRDSSPSDATQPTRAVVRPSSPGCGTRPMARLGARWR